MNITTNTTTEFPVRWKGGEGQFVVTGTPGGATITLVFLDEDNTVWVAAGADTTYADSVGTGIFSLPSGTRLGVLTADGTGMDINANLNCL